MYVLKLSCHRSLPVAGTVCVAVMILNMLMIPMLINKYKEVKVKIKRKRARKSRVDDFDELFD